MKSNNLRFKLNRETVRELNDGQLRAVIAGTLVPTKCNCTGYYPSLNSPCGPSVEICPAG